MKKSVRVQAPCSTSNLGPGLDCLGLALSLHFDLTLEICPQDVSSLDWQGEGGADPALIDSGRELILRAVEEVFTAVGREPVGLKMIARSEIPIRAGLGSSGAVIVAALMAANCLCDNAMSREELVTLGANLEGHPDNVSPAMYGGLTISYVSQTGRVVVQPYPVSLKAKVAVLLPSAQKASTKESRKSFPEEVALSDAIFNQGRTASLVAGLISGRLENGQELFADRLHQERRSEAMPWLPGTISAAYEAGALGAFLSGAGPAIAAFCREADLPVVLDAMDSVVSAHGLASRRFGLDVANEGARRT